jgi:hypothetical protein
MYHWLTFILGIVILSLGISNPFYNLIIKRYLRSAFIFDVILRIFLFIVGISVVFLGLYIESMVNNV